MADLQKHSRLDQKKIFKAATTTKLLEECFDGIAASRGYFITYYSQILTDRIMNGSKLFIGHSKVVFSVPYINKKNSAIGKKDKDEDKDKNIKREHIENAIYDIAYDVCVDFLNKKLLPDFIRAVHENHQGKGAKKISTRTTLQIALWNRLKKVFYAQDRPLRAFKDANNNLYELQWIDEHYELEKEHKTLAPSHYGLMHFRRLLANTVGKIAPEIADKGKSKNPPAMECYSLYYGLIDPQKYKSLIPENSELLNKLPGSLSDQIISELLSIKYKTKCSRKVCNNRRRKYEQVLVDYIKAYDPEVSDKEAMELVAGTRQIYKDMLVESARTLAEIGKLSKSDLRNAVENEPTISG